MKKLSNASSGVVTGLIDYLSETGQKEVLPEVAGHLADLIASSRGADKILVTSVIDLSNTQLSILKQTICTIIGTNLPIVNKTSKNLLAGFTVSVGDWFLDASLIKQLENLKSGLLQ